LRAKFVAGPLRDVCRAGLGLFDEALRGDSAAVGKLIENKLIPQPGSFNPTPIDHIFVAKLFFLANTKPMLFWLNAQFQRAAQQEEALGKIRNRTRAQEADLKDAKDRRIKAAQAIRELRMAYTKLRDEQGVGGLSFPDPRELNFPF
jgi:hypothetical protein